MKWGLQRNTVNYFKCDVSWDTLYMDMKNLMYHGTPCIWTWKMWCIVGHPVYGLEKCDVSWDTLYMDMKNVMYHGTPCIWTWKMWCIVGHPIYGHEKWDETPWIFASSSRIHNLSPLLKISKLKTSLGSNFYKN